MTIEAYPLSWPHGWKRTPAHRQNHGRFSTKSQGQYGRVSRELSISESTQRVLRELKAMGVDDWHVIISTNIPLRRDGLPRSDARTPDDAGAAVYWTDGDKKRVMAIDQYHRVADNLAAIAATIDAMRAIERHGGAVILDRAFEGFTALPAPANDWSDVLGIDKNTATVDDIEQAYLRKRKETHPDYGGTSDAFIAVQKAYEHAHQHINEN